MLYCIHTHCGWQMVRLLFRVLGTYNFRWRQKSSLETCFDCRNSVSNTVEFSRAGLGSLIPINSEFNDTSSIWDCYRGWIDLWQISTFKINVLCQQSSKFFKKKILWRILVCKYRRTISIIMVFFKFSLLNYFIYQNWALIFRGSSSTCSSLKGLSSTIVCPLVDMFGQKLGGAKDPRAHPLATGLNQLRIDSFHPAKACPWKYCSRYAIISQRPISCHSSVEVPLKEFTECNLEGI